MSSSEDEEEAWREYPIWLQAAVRDESEEKTVRVLDDDPCGDAPKNGRVRVKAIEMVDTLEHAKGGGRQRHRLQADSVILVTAGPAEQPYIGLITKIWLEQGAPSEARGGATYYSPQHFWFDMYYFYRFTEAPIDAKRRPAAEKSAMRGSVLNVAMSAGGKLKRVQEEGSERQVMFSNHATWNDGEGICAESFLYPTQVHWLGESEKFPPVYYEGPNGRLCQRLARGFVARLFNYLKAGKPQHGEQGEVYSLAERWPDEVTMRLAAQLRREYQERDQARAQENARLLALHQQRREQQRQQAQAQAQKAQQQQQQPRPPPVEPPSPQLSPGRGGGAPGGGAAPGSTTSAWRIPVAGGYASDMEEDGL